MKGIDWKRKLTSRKFWLAVALFVSGVITAAGDKALAETISGLIMQFAAVLAYLIGEGLVDASNKEIGEGILLEQTVEATEDEE